MRFDFDAFKSSVKKLQDRLVSIQSEIDELTRKRSALQNAAAARSDVKAMIERWVDRNGATLAPATQQILSKFVSRPELTQGNMFVDQVLTLHADGIGAAADQPLDQVDHVLCALFGQQIKAALFKVVDEMTWPSAEGLPLAQRAEQLALIDRQLEPLHREQNELVEKAQEAGLNVNVIV